jgi:uncharacterized protein with HEPN domain
LNPAERDFLGYLDDILENARKLKSLIAGLSFEEFQADEKTQYAIMRAIEVIGDILIHQYEGVDPSVLYATAAREIDVVIERLPAIIDELVRDP